MTRLALIAGFSVALLFAHEITVHKRLRNTAEAFQEITEGAAACMAGVFVSRRSSHPGGYRRPDGPTRSSPGLAREPSSVLCPWMARLSWETRVRNEKLLNNRFQLLDG